MSEDPKLSTSIRHIDNSRQLLPFFTTLLVIFLIWVIIWFFRGGSFRLYASAFFGLYYLTRQIWVSVLLMGILQNIVFLPLRYIGLKVWNRVEDFEAELEKTSEDEQYLLFSKKVKEGNKAIIFFIFNFVVNAIAFFSAGRIFLIDFYTKPLSSGYLYHFIPYPEYPLHGTNFYFPFFKITETISLPWQTILLVWVGITVLFAAPKLLWRFVKWLFWKNKSILSARINYNRLLLKTGGFSTLVFILSLIILRHIPVNVAGWMLIADLTRQNTTMNTVTAIGTFITAVHAGYVRQLRASEAALKANVPQAIVDKVFREKMRQSFKNGIILGLGAFLVTNQIPCAFELSVATFEVLYILSPYTFDRLLLGVKPITPAVVTPA